MRVWMIYFSWKKNGEYREERMRDIRRDTIEEALELGKKRVAEEAEANGWDEWFIWDVALTCEDGDEYTPVI